MHISIATLSWKSATFYLCFLSELIAIVVDWDIMASSNVTEMIRQQSTLSTMRSECSDDDMDNYYDYDEDALNSQADGDVTSKFFASGIDPEHFSYTMMPVDDAKTLFDGCESRVSASDVTDSQPEVVKARRASSDRTLRKRNSSQFMYNNNELCVPKRQKQLDTQEAGECLVCYDVADCLPSADCGHGYCATCWNNYIEAQISEGVFGKIRCMNPDCQQQLTETFVLNLLKNDSQKKKYMEFSLREKIENHPQLRFCPGVDCDQVVKVAAAPKARRVKCSKCRSTFCFLCGSDYHAPIDCEGMKKWALKCHDDSETANYMVANTKSCPECHVLIEKNGGCNHMQCFKCEHDFCWTCLGNWEAHDSYYTCSKYKQNDQTSTVARSALEKYIFYFERWNNHSRSAELEKETRRKIEQRIEQKVMQSEGTWIDWQYLLTACDLLSKCRYTLRYTYPCAYFIEPGLHYRGSARLYPHGMELASCNLQTNRGPGLPRGTS